MKVAFSREVEYIPEWNKNKELPEEEQVKAILRPLELADLISLMDGLQKASGGEVDPVSLTSEGISKNIDQVRALIDSAGHLLPKYSEVSGIEDESGPVLSSDLVKYPYYLELGAELLTELASISMPNEAETKN